MSHEEYGIPEAAPPTKTFGGIWHHPLNPTYTTVQVPKLKTLPSFGYALVEEELSKRELDDDILSKENEILQKRLLNDDVARMADTTITKRKLKNNDSNGIESKSEENVTADMNSNYFDANNNNSSNTSSVVKRNKSSLNANDDSSCPGLASSAVTYNLD